VPAGSFDRLRQHLGVRLLKPNRFRFANRSGDFASGPRNGRYRRRPGRSVQSLPCQTKRPILAACLVLEADEGWYEGLCCRPMSVRVGFVRRISWIAICSHRPSCSELCPPAWPRREQSDEPRKRSVSVTRTIQFRRAGPGGSPVSRRCGASRISESKRHTLGQSYAPTEEAVMSRFLCVHGRPRRDDDVPADAIVGRFVIRNVVAQRLDDGSVCLIP